MIGTLAEPLAVALTNKATETEILLSSTNELKTMSRIVRVMYRPVAHAFNSQ